MTDRYFIGQFNRTNMQKFRSNLQWTLTTLAIVQFSTDRQLYRSVDNEEELKEEDILPTLSSTFQFFHSTPSHNAQTGNSKHFEKTF